MFAQRIVFAAGIVGAACGAAFADVRAAVVPGDQASMALVKRGSSPATFINSGGHVLVTRGNAGPVGGFTPIGNNVNSPTASRILAQWDEVVEGDKVFVRSIWKTEFGEELMPIDQLSLGFFFWNWNLGEVDPVNFQFWVTTINIIRADYFLSTDGGATLTSFPYFGLSSPWDGKDPGQLLTSVGAGYNYIETRVQYDVIPAPGAPALLALAGLAVTRRPRR